MQSESLAEKSLTILNEKSKKAHALVAKIILEEKIGIRKIDRTIEQYLSRWNDTTRPGVLSIALEAVGGKSEEAVPIQVALSFIDATMDIHDDLIDGSISKKKVKTIYGKLGKEATLLIGDDFMVKGFNYLHKAIEGFPKSRQRLVMNTISNFLRVVVEAHISEAEMKKKKWTVEPEEYLEILKKKAADIEGRMKVGAICGGGSKKEIDALGTFGRNLGVLLAVRAEYIDIFEPSELMHRIKYECLPLHILYALGEKPQREKIFQRLSKKSLDKNDSYYLLEIIQETKTITALKENLRKMEKEAIRALNKLSSSQEKACLTLIITSMLEDL